jgi:hypothetical protein
MKIDIEAEERQVRGLIDQFFAQKIKADDFCSSYTEYWMRLRDEQEKIKLTWAEPFDQRIIEARVRGEIDADEFARRYSELWGFKGVLSFYEMVDAIHSACSSYNPSPQYDWEIGEDQLKDEVQQLLTKYEREKASA